MAARTRARQIMKLLMEHFSDTSQSQEHTLGDFLMFAEECTDRIQMLKDDGVEATMTDLESEDDG